MLMPQSRDLLVTPSRSSEKTTVRSMIRKHWKLMVSHSSVSIKRKYMESVTPVVEEEFVDVEDQCVTHVDLT